jgi:hypothetical protein
MSTTQLYKMSTFYIFGHFDINFMTNLVTNNTNFKQFKEE